MFFQVQSAGHIEQMCTSLQSLRTRVAELDAHNPTERRQVSTMVACNLVKTLSVVITLDIHVVVCNLKTRLGPLP